MSLIGKQDVRGDAFTAKTINIKKGTKRSAPSPHVAVRATRKAPRDSSSESSSESPSIVTTKSSKRSKSPRRSSRRDESLRDSVLPRGAATTSVSAPSDAISRQIAAYKPKAHFEHSAVKPNPQVILLVTDNTHEFQQTLRVLYDSSQINSELTTRWVSPNRAGRPYYSGAMGAYSAVVVQCQQGSGTLGGSQDTVRDALDEFPDVLAVIAVGVCGGATAKQVVGTVIVSTSVVMYDPKKKSSTTQQRGDVASMNAALLNVMRAGVGGWDAPIEATFVNEEVPDIVAGPIFSGETLMDDQRKALSMMKRRKAIAFEMEGAGVHAACDGGARSKPWIVVKTVTDLGPAGVEKKEDSCQGWGATVAARYVEWALRKNALSLLTN